MESKVIRLNKVLRELNISLDRAVEFLDSKGIEIQARPTTKISNVDYHILLEGFQLDAQKKVISQELAIEINERKEELRIKEQEKKIKLEEEKERVLKAKKEKKVREMTNYEDQIINEFKTLIVTSSNHKKNPEQGFPKPQCSYISDFEVVRVGRPLRDEMFPNSGYIFVINNYTRDIKDRFHDKEFFKINYKETRNFFPDDRGISKYEAESSTAEKLPLLIEDDINNILSNKEIKLPYEYHSYVFVKDNGNIYGPLAINQIEEDIIDDVEEEYIYKVQPLLTKTLSLKEGYENVIHVYNEDDIVDFIISNDYGKNDYQDFHITNYEFLVKNIEPKEIILNEEIEETIRIVEEVLTPSYDNKIVIAELNEVNKIRYNKYIKVKTKSEKWKKYLEENIFSEYLKTEEGIKQLTDFFNKEKEELLENEIEKIKEKAKVSAEAKLNEELEVLKNEKKELIDSINKRSSEKLKLEDEIEIVKQKNQELNEVENKIEEKQKELGLFLTLEDLISTIEEKEKRENELRIIVNNEDNRLKKLEEQKKEIEDSLKDVSKELIIKRIGEIQPYFELMNGSSNQYLKTDNIVINFFENINEITFNKLEVNENNLDKLIEDLYNFLHSKGRNYKKEEVFNFVILYFQNFLIIFSGLPGIGKTSLSNLLSEFFTRKEFFLELAVSKGWNSRKVLLGYNNPINNVYQYDEFDFVKTLISFNKINPDLPLNILLDEANLSPVEYYWSDFISFYDKEANERILKLDNEKNINVPKQIKFMATINNDHTTEKLSPRLIDRAPIVTLENENSKVLETIKNKEYLFDGYYNFNDVYNVINPNNLDLLSPEENILNDVFSILRLEGDIVISQRKGNSIKKYCTVSRDLMTEYAKNQYAHIDYAIAQFVLPQIQGQGKGFADMLNNLLEVFEKKQLTKSVKILKKIQKRGANFQVFSFFN